MITALVPVHPDASLCVKDELWPLTGESTPAGDVAGGPMGEDETLLWEAGGCDSVGEADRRRQFDQGNVVAVA